MQQQQQQCRLVNPYQVLQIRRDATRLEIQRAYQRLALWHSPNRRVVDMSEQEGTRRRQMFITLAACYEVLMDKDAKVRLDGLLKEEEQQTTADYNVSPPCDEIDPAAPENGRWVQNTSGVSADQHQSTTQPLLDYTKSFGTSPSVTRTNNSWMPTSSIPRRRRPRRQQRNKTLHGADSRQAFSLWRRNSPMRNIRDHEAAPANDGHNECVDAEVQGIHIAMSSSSSSSSTDGGGEKHYTETETNRLFGGPLHLLYRARRWKPFSDPFQVFARAFQSQAWEALPINASSVAGDWPPTSMNDCRKNSSTWIGSSERLEDGTTKITTNRALHNRRLVRTEIIRVDPLTGQRHSQISVTSEPLDLDPDLLADGSATICGLELTFCFPCGAA